MKMRRMFAALLVAALLLSVLPTHVLRVSAAEGEKIGGLFLDKTATLTDNGTYTIDLEAYATGTPVKSTVTEGIPLDIVLVIDQSGSMQDNGYLDSLRDSVNAFVESIAENGKLFKLNHRVAITTFSNNEEGSQSGTTALSDYTYVGKKDPSWANTGLFKNDGTYENYGTADYEEIKEEDDIDPDSKYYIKVGEDEYAQIFHKDGWWGGWYYYSSADGSTSIGDTSELFDSYTVYKKTSCTDNLDDNDYAAAWMNVSVDNEVNPKIIKAIESFASNGSTYTSYGMIMAKNALDNLPKIEGKRNQLVVVFTDGQPGYSGFESEEANAALAVSAEIKADGADVYTIGLYSSANTNTTNFMNYLSSNYGKVIDMDRVVETYSEAKTVTTPSNFSGSNSTRETECYAKDGDAYYKVSVTRTGSSGNRKYEWHYTDANGTKQTICTTQDYDGNPTLYTRSTTKGTKLSDEYYHTTADMTQLESIFETITVESTTTDTTVTLGADAILKDVLAAGFKLTDQTVITVKTQFGSPKEVSDALELTEDKIDWGAVTTKATLKYPGTTVTEDGYTITVTTDETITTHGSTIDVTGFNYNENYICNGHDGYRLLVTITGIEADASLPTGTEVFTNHGASGIYEPADSDADKDGTFGEAQGSFESPTTYFTNTVVVMDYAKTTDDLKDLILQSGVKHLDNDGMNYFTTANTNFAGKYGNANVTDGKLTYTPNTMKWDGYDAFYAFGNTKDSNVLGGTANKVHENVWSKVTVIPANNVYYEDTFVTNESTGTVGIVFTGEWTKVLAGSNTETPENGEDPKTNEDDESYGGVHGWEDSLADDTGHSDGTAAVGGEGATATFTFTGTGVDIYSYTDLETGLIMASLYAGEKAEGLPLRTLIIDNFAHSGDYYMIPTLSIHKMVKRVNGVTQTDNGNILYENMPHGTYTVKLTVIAVTDNADMEGAETTRSTYYLDGIRVYNPVAIDDTVAGAYGDGEINAVFTEVRDILLHAGNSSGSLDAPVFIDQIVNKNEDGTVTEGDVPGTTTDIGVYEAIGPENEVYLSDGQMIAFAPGAAADKHYYVGLKSPTGEPVDVVIYKDGEPCTFTISHTTDMYYEVTPESGIVVIGNGSENGSLLAITKIKVAGPKTATFAMFRAVSREEVLTAANEAYAAANEPETPDVEIENPEVEAPEVEEPAPETEPNLPELLSKLVKRIFGNLWDWFH